MSDSTIHLFGIRHHGPGSARSLLKALQDLQPDCLLIEGPPEGEDVLPFVLDKEMKPPVALLIYANEDAQQAVFYPFANFSPEWQALRYGLTHQLPTRFIDLPISHQLALSKAREEAEAAASESEPDQEADEPAQDETDAENADTLENAAPQNEETCAPGTDKLPEAGPNLEDRDNIAADPLSWLGRAAGYTDGESWWNHMVEERCDSTALFAAIAEAMQALREDLPAPDPSSPRAQEEALREAHMRKCLREATKEGFQRIAVVCGAWHVPALANMPTAKADAALLKNLPKLKVTATWAPWTYHHLATNSGYGAGVSAPAWYAHLWQHGDKPAHSVRWLARAARLFREEDLDCSSAHIIEAARLADSLAALRQRPHPGLEELCEALQTTVCMGDAAPMQLIHKQLIVGDKLGHVPPDAPVVPLQKDLSQQQKTLRLKPQALQSTLDLDLREPKDLARSHLLHRLRLLNIHWGELAGSGTSTKGTFHEVWSLAWAPKLAVAVIQASRWGHSVEQAAVQFVMAEAAQPQSLPALSQLINQVLLANLAAAIAPVTHALENQAALASDVGQLLEALPPLSNIARYGNVRQTDANMVGHVLASLISRAAIGLSGACTALDDEAASDMRKRIVEAHAAIRLLNDADRAAEWHQALQRIAQPGASHGLLRGLTARLLFDAGIDAIEVTSQHMSQSLSLAVDPGSAAAWLEGFLNQSAMVLLHDAQLWNMVDQWLGGLKDEHFQRVLPLLRRTFSSFSAPERQQIGERAKRPSTASFAKPGPAEWHQKRAEGPIPLLETLLGLSPQPRS